MYPFKKEKTTYVANQSSTSSANVVTRRSVLTHSHHTGWRQSARYLRQECCQRQVCGNGRACCSEQLYNFTLYLQAGCKSWPALWHFCLSRHPESYGQD